VSDSRPVVLVVEDDVEMNELQREFLAVNGLDSVAAYTGREALEAYQRQSADAVLLDVMLPELDGYETCRRIRAINHGRVPIILVTALDSDECRRRGYDAGADAYFTKPFNPDEVVFTIQKLIEEASGGNGRG
jgi:DNA-binding response OmpR family regulator